IASNWRVERRRELPPPPPPPEPLALPLMGGCPPPATGARVAANAAAAPTPTAPTPIAACLPVFLLFAGGEAAPLAPFAPGTRGLVAAPVCGKDIGIGIGIGPVLDRGRMGLP